MVYDYTDPAYRNRPDVLLLRLNGKDRSITFNAMDRPFGGIGQELGHRRHPPGAVPYREKIISWIPGMLRGIWRAERYKVSAAQDPWSQLWADFTRHGGQTGYLELFPTAADRAKKLEKELKALDRGMTGKAAHAVLDFLDDYNQSIVN